MYPSAYSQFAMSWQKFIAYGINNCCPYINLCVLYLSDDAA